MEFSGYLEPEEVRKIIQAVSDVSRHANRDTLLFETMWQSGARVSEVIILKPERIGMSSLVLTNLKQRKRVKVKDSEGHTRYEKVSDPNATKEVEVTEDLCNRLKAFCEEQEIYDGQYVFYGNVTRSKPVIRWYVWDIMQKASEHAKIYCFGKKNPKTGGRYKGAYPHLFRHSTAMYLLDETNNIMIAKQQLGHSNVASTQAYAFAKKTSVKKAIKNIEW